MSIFCDYLFILLHPYQSHELFRKRRIENASLEKGEVQSLSFWAVVIPQLIFILILTSLELYVRELVLPEYNLRIWLLSRFLYFCICCILWAFFASISFKTERIILQCLVRAFGVKGELKKSIQEIYYSSYCCQILFLTFPFNLGISAFFLLTLYFDLGIFFFFLGKLVYIFVGLKANLNLSDITAFSIGICLFILEAVTALMLLRPLFTLFFDIRESILDLLWPMSW